MARVAALDKALSVDLLCRIAELLDDIRDRTRLACASKTLAAAIFGKPELWSDVRVFARLLVGDHLTVPHSLAMRLVRQKTQTLRILTSYTSARLVTMLERMSTNFEKCSAVPSVRELHVEFVTEAADALMLLPNAVDDDTELCADDFVDQNEPKTTEASFVSVMTFTTLAFRMRQAMPELGAWDPRIPVGIDYEKDAIYFAKFLKERPVPPPRVARLRVATRLILQTVECLELCAPYDICMLDSVREDATITERFCSALTAPNVRRLRLVRCNSLVFDNALHTRLAQSSVRHFRVTFVTPVHHLQVSDQQVAFLCSHLPLNLQSLYLSNCLFAEETWAEVVQRPLFSLELEDCSIVHCDPVVPNDAPLLTSLNYLSVLNSGSVLDRCMHAFAARCSELIHMDLTGTTILGQDVDPLVKLAARRTRTAPTGVRIDASERCCMHLMPQERVRLLNAVWLN